MSITNEITKPRATKSWRLSRRLLVIVGVAGIVWGGRVWWMDRRYKSTMQEIESEILGGRYAIACRKIDQLLSWKADSSGGLMYLLGSCELARARNKAAEETWERIAPGSKFSERAIRGRLRLFVDAGRLAGAEQLISAAALDPRNDRTALLTLLVPIFSDQGRIDEAGRLITDRWAHLNARGEGALEPAIKLVRQHIELTLKDTSIETVRATLEKASRLAPDDDRVWLGRANLAIRTGAYDEAARTLDACQQRRPEDIPVWRARMHWGVATNQIEVVKQAITHVLDAGSPPAERHRLNAWIAARQGDFATERRELELLVEVDPADTMALDRLTELARKDGQPARAAELLSKQADVKRLRARYLKLHDRTQPVRDAAELARLAEQLGRRFEAEVFRAIAQSQDDAQ